ncbi:hypothetical protein V8F20_009232 [Naviculisporaceae sp. PSN 640]
MHVISDRLLHRRATSLPFLLTVLNGTLYAVPCLHFHPSLHELSVLIFMECFNLYRRVIARATIRAQGKFWFSMLDGLCLRADRCYSMGGLFNRWGWRTFEDLFGVPSPSMMQVSAFVRNSIKSAV